MIEFSDRISSVKPSAIREILKMSNNPDIISFAAGNPSSLSFPVEEIKKITEDIFNTNPFSVLQYSVSEGYYPLREQISVMLKEKNIIANIDNILVTSGAQQGIEMIAKILCNEKDTVICEDPSFVGALNAFRTYNVNLVGVPMDNEGIELNNLEKAFIENKNTKFLYLIPNFQNPTGKTMSLNRRKSVYELCKKYNVFILEDNPYGDLRFEGEDVPNIKSFDTEGLVFYVGSFSKILSPGLRVGFVCAKEDVIKKLTVAKQCSDVHTNILAQKICSEYIKNYDLNEHIKSIKKIYKDKYDLMMKSIKSEFSNNVKFFDTEGGLFVWCILPNNYDVTTFATEALKRYKVAVVPGSAFLADETQQSSCFRLNFSKPSDEEIVKGIGYLGKLTKELFD